MLVCGLLFWCFWSLLDLGSWNLLGLALVLKLDLVREFVCDSRLKERQVVELVSVGVIPRSEEFEIGVNVVIFKGDEVVIEEHGVWQRGPDERFAWCEGGWTLVLCDAVVDETFLDGS